MHFTALLILGTMATAQTIASPAITTSTSTSSHTQPPYCAALRYVFDENCWDLHAEKRHSELYTCREREADGFYNCSEDD